MTTAAKEGTPEPGKTVLFFFFGRSSFERGWRIGWVLGDGTWIAKQTRDDYRHPAELVTHWRELPPDPPDECAHKFVDGKPCTECRLTVHEFELAFYSEEDES